MNLCAGSLGAGLDGIAALMTCPRHLHSIVVGINIVGGLVKITVARACDLIIQRSKEFGIDVRRVGVAGVLHHCTDRNQVGIAAVSAAVGQIPAAVANICDFEQTLPRCFL